MKTDWISEIRRDCLIASDSQPDVRSKLSFQHISITGGTGFLGSWLAEMVAALNDEYNLGISLDLYARNVSDWNDKNTHLSKRSDIRVRSQDVRSHFNFERNTNFVVHAAGIPNNRVQSSDPLRVHQTTIQGLKNTLDAASQLDNLSRFLNISSGLVNGQPTREGALKEGEYFSAPSGQLHNVYSEAKRSAEGLATIYRSQFRLPISTLRPFTFAGPYQELDRPWAFNNFLKDFLTGSDVRLHGDGNAVRSYLYGSDAAWWVIAALANGSDGETYNLGGGEAVTHLELIKLMLAIADEKPKILINHSTSNLNRLDSWYPDLTHTQKSLGVRQTCTLEQMVDKTWRWFSKPSS
jgi:nucleoside-diphosphate-sugar epimerase